MSDEPRWVLEMAHRVDFSKHQITKIGINTWKCWNPALGSIYRFFVFTYPTHGVIHMWGDIFAISLRCGSEDPLKWLRSSCRDIDYVMQKLMHHGSSSDVDARKDLDVDAIMRHIDLAAEEGWFDKAQMYVSATEILGMKETIKEIIEEFGTGHFARGKIAQEWLEVTGDCEVPIFTMWDHMTRTQLLALRYFTELWSKLPENERYDIQDAPTKKTRRWAFWRKR